MRDLWSRLENNPRFFTCFWGGVSSFAVWLIVEHSGDALLFLGSSALGGLADFIDSRYERAAVLQPTTYSYFILSIIFVMFAVGWSETSSKISKNLKGEDSENNELNKAEIEIPKWLPLAFIPIRIVIWFFFGLALLFLAGESIVLNAISDFSQHMRIIAPYIDDQREDEIMSKWSQMESLKDYNAVCAELIKISKENNLKLKRNQLY